MRRTATEAELEYITDVTFKRDVISHNYLQYGIDGDIQDYLMEQLDANPKLLAWLFDDLSLIGKSHLSLDCGRFEAFQDFYNTLSIYDD